MIRVERKEECQLHAATSHCVVSGLKQHTAFYVTILKARSLKQASLHKAKEPAGPSFLGTTKKAEGTSFCVRLWI